MGVWVASPPYSKIPFRGVVLGSGSRSEGVLGCCSILSVVVV